MLDTDREDIYLHQLKINCMERDYAEIRREQFDCEEDYQFAVACEVDYCNSLIRMHKPSSDVK